MTFGNCLYWRLCISSISISSSSSSSSSKIMSITQALNDLNDDIW